MTELELHTPRLLISALQAQDHELYCKLFTDERTMRFIGPPLTSTHALRNFELVVRRAGNRSARQVLWRIVERATGLTIGICSLHCIDRKRRTAEVGLMFEPERQGLGFGRETLATLVDAAFRVFPIDQIWVQYQADNVVAARLFIGAGFRPGARVRADERAARTRMLSAFRHSWSSTSNVHQLGVHACQT